MPPSKKNWSSRPRLSSSTVWEDVATRHLACAQSSSRSLRSGTLWRYATQAAFALVSSADDATDEMDCTRRGEVSKISGNMVAEDGKEEGELEQYPSSIQILLSWGPLCMRSQTRGAKPSSEP
ncbi:unnamed protein product [Mycena citricolor]|uniref:Uncharacterized protein n=1 Tax=Mycena citricolor TaxID=2018698 RepID=A0AAD2K3H3_9AGAR|nr:unnamed protein product [Mycena citricolor]